MFNPILPDTYRPRLKDVYSRSNHDSPSGKAEVSKECQEANQKKLNKKQELEAKGCQWGTVVTFGTQQWHQDMLLMLPATPKEKWINGLNLKGKCKTFRKKYIDNIVLIFEQGES